MRLYPQDKITAKCHAVTTHGSALGRALRVPAVLLPAGKMAYQLLARGSNKHTIRIVENTI